MRRRRNGRQRSVGHSILKLTGGLVILVVLAAGALAVRLGNGPIAVEGVGRKIEAGLHDKFGNGLRFSIGATALVHHGFGPALAIDGLSVSAPDGQPILTAPKAEVSVDTLSLLVGKIVPKRLEVFDVTLRLAVLKNGNLAVEAGGGSKPLFEIGGSPGASASPAAAPIPAEPPTIGNAANPDPPEPPRRAAVMREAAAGILRFLDLLTDPGSAIAAVDRLGIARGTLVIEDRETEARTVYKDLELSFDRRRGAMTFGLSARGPDRRWSIVAVASGAPKSNRHFKLAVDNLSVDELQLAAGTRSLGVDTDMPIDVKLDVGLKSDDTLAEAKGGFHLGPGYIRNDDPDMEPLLISSLQGGFHWDGAHRRVVVEQTRLIERGSHFTVGGEVVPPLDGSEAWAVNLGLIEPGLLAPDRKGQQPVPIMSGDFKGMLLVDQKRFRIDRFAFKAAEGGMAMAADIDWIKGPHIRLGASIDPTPVRVAERVWPNMIAAPVRAWILNNFESGTLQSGTIQVDFDGEALKRMRADRAPSDRSVSLDFAVTGGRVAFLDGVPPLEDVAGVGHITGRTTHFAVNSAKILAHGKTITVDGGSLVVQNANKHPVAAVISAHLNGSVEAVTDILSRDALKPYASIPLDPTTLHGQVDGRLEDTLLLGGPTKTDGVLKVNAKITNFTAEHLIGKESLDNGTLNIVVDDGALKATGQGRFFGGPATFDVTRVGTIAPPNASIALTLDDAARAKVGLSAIPGVTGPMTAHVTAALGNLDKIRAQVELDLTKTNISAAYLGLSKPAGRAAKVSFTALSNNDRLQIDALNVDVGSLQARGMIELGPNNGFQAARLSSLKVSPGDDMKLDVTKTDDVLKLTIRGSTIDARPFLKALTSSPGDNSAMQRNAKAEKREVDGFKGFDVDLKSGILTGFNKEVMSGVDLKLSKRGGQIRQFNVQGRFGRYYVSGSMGASQKIKIAAYDAGALVSFVDLYKHMEGGQLDAVMQMDEDTLSGNLEIQNFVLRDEPAIRRLVAQSTELSAPGQDAAAAKRINAGAVDFKRLKVNFNREGSRLDLRDATMYGPEIGLSVDGWLDYSHDRVAMNGTFVPVFALNNLFAQIPVLGAFLGGKSNEGLLAITFRISGTTSSPTLSINPLSAVTPGFLRNIFGGIVDTPLPAPPGAASR